MKRSSTFWLMTVALLFVAAASSPAAVIKGTVNDTLTQAKVESVLVTVKGTAVRAYTNVQGVFTLNTTNGIRDWQTSVPALAWSTLRGTTVKVYGPDGAHVADGKADEVTGRLAGSPDGIYFVEARKDGQLYTGRIIKTYDRCQTGDLTAASAKAAAAVTLVYAHKYYNTKEAAAAEGDTNVAMKLRMWFPDSITTGPTGNLTASAALTVTQNGAVIQNLNVNGGITIKASNVTIRNCIFGSLNISVYDSFFTGIVVEDCKLGWAGVRNFTLRRCELSSASDDLIRVGGVNVTVEDCYLHVDGPEVAGTHCDIMQEYPVGTGAHCLVRHNTLYIAIRQNSCVFDLTDVLVESNLLAGAGYTMYVNSGYRVVNNHFSTKFFPSCGYWGPMTGTPGTCTSNVWHETGAAFNCQ